MNKFTGSKTSFKSRLSGLEVKISMGRLIALALIGVMLLGWSFFIGVLVGRGERPETMVPEIAAIMPSQNSSSDSGQMQAMQNENRVIPPEELDFMGNLKTKPSNADLPAAPLATNIPPKPEPVAERNKERENAAAPAPKPQGKPKSQEKPKEKPKPAPEKEKAKPERGSGEDVFDYVYQVAASGDKSGAENLKNKLIKNGMDAFVVETEKEGSKLYRINLRFRGTPEETNILNKKLADVGLKRKILITKKLASGG